MGKKAVCFSLGGSNVQNCARLFWTLLDFVRYGRPANGPGQLPEGAQGGYWRQIDATHTKRNWAMVPTKSH